MDKPGRIGIQVVGALIGMAIFAPAACGPNMKTVGIDLRYRLLYLEPGLTRDSVDTIMGTDSVKVTKKVYADGVVASPFRAGSFETDGAEWDVLQYLVYPKNNDGRIEQDELVPLVLKDAILQGWGWEYLYGVAGLGYSPGDSGDAEVEGSAAETVGGDG